jgi:bacteriophage CI repressor helix-turn-helix domain
MINIMIGQRIKSARKLRQRSQKWLAEEVGVTQSSVSEWETGKSGLSTANLSSLAEVLDVNFEWLATGRGEMDTPAHTMSYKLINPSTPVSPIETRSEPLNIPIEATRERESAANYAQKKILDELIKKQTKQQNHAEVTGVKITKFPAEIYSPEKLNLMKQLHRSYFVRSNQVRSSQTRLNKKSSNYYTEEQREFLRLFDALPKSKREVLLTFMRDWINLK